MICFGDDVRSKSRCRVRLLLHKLLPNCPISLFNCPMLSNAVQCWMFRCFCGWRLRLDAVFQATMCLFSDRCIFFVVEDCFSMLFSGHHVSLLRSMYILSETRLNPARRTNLLCGLRRGNNFSLDLKVWTVYFILRCASFNGYIVSVRRLQAARNFRSYYFIRVTIFEHSSVYTIINMFWKHSHCNPSLDRW